MLSEITSRLIFHLDQCLFERLPAEYVDSHGSQVAARMRRLLLELGDTVILIGDHDTEAACLFDRHRHTGNGHICLICLMIIKHHFVIHLVNMIS